jgi:DNA-binding response OmpR family regulator
MPSSEGAPIWRALSGFWRRKSLILFPDLTASMLVDMAWDVYVATSEDMAYESLVERRPDILIADIEMDFGAGFNAISRARRLCNDLFIVAVTRGGYERIWIKNAIACGANIYIVGPISSSKLTAAISTGLNKGLSASELPPVNNYRCH